MKSLSQVKSKYGLKKFHNQAKLKSSSIPKTWMPPANYKAISKIRIRKEVVKAICN
jgi:hypothetical protein